MCERWLRPAVAAALLLVALCPAAAGQDKEHDVKSTPAELNRRFVDPQADVDEWIRIFESESREVFDAREDVTRASGIRAGDRVADIGAGTGLYTRIFAEIAGQKGWVYAVDIGPAFLEHINRTSAEAGLNNVTAVLGRLDSIGLAPGSIDVAFLCDTYHHLELVEPMLASIHSALAPGGRLVVVDFDRIPGQSREWILDHVRAGKEETRAEIEAAGFTFVEEVEIERFEENYFIKFRKK